MGVARRSGVAESVGPRCRPLVGVAWVVGVVAGGCASTDHPVCADPIEVPPTLGIEDDSASWSCGDLPESPRNLRDFGLTAAGVTACFAGEGPAIAGGDIYVAPTGDDGNAGDSAGAPLATLAEALCRVRPGQTVHLAPGRYRGPGAVVGMLGNAGSSVVTIRGDGDAPSEVILDGEGWRSVGLGFVESHHVRVENLTVERYTNAGIWTLTGGDIALVGIESRDNGRCSLDPESEGEGFGVNLVGTEDIEVSGSLFEHNGPLLSSLVCGDVLGTGINTFEVSGRIQDNVIRATRGGAMLVEDGHDVTVSGNLAEGNFLLAVDNYWDAALWVDGSRDVSVTDNTFTDNWGGAGLMITDEEGGYPEVSTGIRATGNTITGHLAGILVWGYGVCPPPADAILGYDDLDVDNTLTGNAFGGQDRAVWCDPEFVGGDRP